MNSSAKPIAVLVHGAYADSSSFDDVIVGLQARGYRAFAIANPLRSVAADSDYTKRVLAKLDGPLVLVGHSWGGMVISQAAVGNPNVTALVYLAGFAPESGESAADLSGRFPGSSLAETLVAHPLADGSNDTYIAPEKYHQQFAGDLSEEKAAVMAVTQRPITDRALGEPASGDTQAWTNLPSYFLFGDQDRNIPVAAHRFMAERAGAKRVEEVAGASHVVGMSHPDLAVSVIVDALEAGDRG
ncbi:alpha/beta fold hydrolase [Lysobacter korlensis]|uniref:Alpha/beta fold hydrolase n=1 Tax=Lysobacter korlensis TaxID=553636 RepID=A0ABV6RZA1_9GAMM